MCVYAVSVCLVCVCYVCMLCVYAVCGYVCLLRVYVCVFNIYTYLSTCGDMDVRNGARFHNFTFQADSRDDNRRRKCVTYIYIYIYIYSMYACMYVSIVNKRKVGQSVQR